MQEQMKMIFLLSICFLALFLVELFQVSFSKDLLLEI